MKRTNVAPAIANGSHSRGRSGVANPIANGSRVLSHAGNPVAVAVPTTTLLAVVCGVSGSTCIASNGDLPATLTPRGRLVPGDACTEISGGRR